MFKKQSKVYYKNDDLLVKIGEKIRKCRVENNLSIENLAHECEVDYSQVNRMELGKVNFGISYLYKIAAALNVNPKDLLPEDF